LSREIPTEALDAAPQLAPIVAVVEQDDPKISGFAIQRSPSDPALVLRERPLKPLARAGGIDQRVEEDSAVALGQDERFMLRNRPPCGFRQRSHAELHQHSPFELSGALDQSLGWFINPEPEPRYPQMPFALCRGRHVHLRAKCAPND
jgi:hypothetical protein